MEVWKEVRREVLTGQLSQRAVIAKYGLGWHTLKKILAHDAPSLPGSNLPVQNTHASEARCESLT